MDLTQNTSIDSDKDADDVDGSIRFASTLDGAHELTLNADTGNIDFVGNVGSSVKLTSITVTKAQDITVGTTENSASIYVGSFTQNAGTGTTDFGSDTINIDTSIEVTTQDIRGKIIGKNAAATLTATNDIIVEVDVRSLSIQSKNAEIEGKVNGQEGGDDIIIRNRGRGSYTFNGRVILGTGRGTRTYSELSSLPLPRVWSIRHQPLTPADNVFTPFNPIFRSSVNDSIYNPYATDVYGMRFPLLSAQLGTEDDYEHAQNLFNIHAQETLQAE